MSDSTISNRALSRSLALVAIAVTVAVLALFTLGSRSSVTAATGADHPRTCFPISKWDANPGLRPCARVTRVFEDGSLRVRVEDADGHIRYRAGVGARDR